MFATAIAGGAHAQEPKPEDLATARQLAIEGVSLADGGDCKGAIEKLDRAAKLYAAPTILGRLGECQVARGQLVAGTENLRRVVNESLPPTASKAFVDAKARAAKVLATAEPRLARVTIRVVGAPATAAHVTLDGAPVPSAALDVPRYVDPGDHKLAASAEGFYAFTKEVRATEGSAQVVEITLEPKPVAAPTAPAVVSAAPPIVAPPPSIARSSKVAPQPARKSVAAVAVPWAATVVLAGGAAVTGALALSASSSLSKQRATFGADPSDLDATSSRANRFAIASDVLTVSAVAMGAFAIFMTVRAPSSERSRAALWVTPSVGGATMSGEF